jgi:hypothetical protein
MLCQYSRCDEVSSEKHETTPDAGVDEGGGDASGILTATAVVGGYWALLECPEVMSRAAKAAKTLRSRTPARWSLKTSLLERLAEPCEDVPPARREFVQAAHAMVRPRHLARPRDLASPDPPHSRDGVVGAWNGRDDDGGAVAGAAGDVVAMQTSC